MARPAVAIVEWSQPQQQRQYRGHSSAAPRDSNEATCVRVTHSLKKLSYDSKRRERSGREPCRVIHFGTRRAPRAKAEFFCRLGHRNFSLQSTRETRLRKLPSISIQLAPLRLRPREEQDGGKESAFPIPGLLISRRFARP